MKATLEKLRGWLKPVSYRLIPVRKVLNGSLERPTFGIAQSFFVRGLGLIYLIAVLSWWVQIDGLVGSNGVIPAANYMEAAKNHFSAPSGEIYWKIPTFLLWNASDGALHALCGLGVLLSIAVVGGYRQGPCLLLLWLVYLSLVKTGGVFMSFQWDILLQEAGLLGILFAPWGGPLDVLKEGGAKVGKQLVREPLRGWIRPRQIDPQASRWMVFLIWFLLFKLMFFSGILKVANDDTWRNGLALTYHYETQPIPHAVAWFAHHLPVWIQRLSSQIMLFIEIWLPFAIFLGRRLRFVAGIGILGLMVMIMATGNFTYFNLLTMLLCIPLFDDRQWPGFVKRWVQSEPQEKTGPDYVIRTNFWAGRGIRGLAGVLILALSIQVCQRQLIFEARWLKEPFLPQFINAPLTRLSQVTAPFDVTSGYGLFRVMTTKRPEIIIEGSNDGETWQSYQFRWKPDDRLDRAPPLVAPHQPRMDWQMWFAALGYQYQRSPRTQWFENLMVRTLQGQPEVLQLFAHNPFADQPPQYLRARIYHYNFTSQEEKAQTGNWWRREELGLYFPVIERRVP